MRLSRLLLFLALAAATLLPLLAPTAAQAAAKKPTPTPAPAAEAAATAPAIEDEGDFTVAYLKPKNKQYTVYYNAYKSGQELQAVADSLNGTFALPTDIPIRLEQCGESNAFYDPSTVSIEICYELVDDLNTIFTDIAGDPKDQEAIDNAAYGALLAVFYHELGHALIDQYDLPATGKEEDAVDQLSTLILLDETDQGLQDALNGADFFRQAAGEVNNVNDIAFWDEHSLDEQRFYNIICWAYGQAPDEHDFLLESSSGDGGWLPQERADLCPGEYARMEHAWLTLLAPYIKGSDWANRPDGLLQAPIKDKGNFSVTYLKPQDRQLLDAYTLVAPDDAFGDAAKELNDTFALPADLKIIFKECGEVNAYYEPDTRSLNMCYELIDSLTQTFDHLPPTNKSKPAAPPDVSDSTINALLFVFFHELGHALIDQYDLPTTGKEEDAVDQLATLVMTGDTKATSRDALAGAEFFAGQTPADLQVEDLTFWDEHSLDQQRYYNIQCWVYGQNPKQNADLVGDDALPQERADLCPGEWSRLETAWGMLLAPFVKD